MRSSNNRRCVRGDLGVILILPLESGSASLQCTSLLAYSLHHGWVRCLEGQQHRLCMYVEHLMFGNLSSDETESFLYFICLDFAWEVIRENVL